MEGYSTASLLKVKYRVQNCNTTPPTHPLNKGLALESLEVFRQKIESLTFDQCPYNLCREYVHGLRYID